MYGKKVVNERGVTLYLDEGDSRSDAMITSRGNFNPHSLSLWDVLVHAREWTTIVDVGANYGEMLLGVELPRASEIIAFEPNPVIADHLHRSLAQAKIDARVEQVAVSDYIGWGYLNLHPEWSGMSSLEVIAGSDKIPVAMTSLDGYFLGRHAGELCLKIDIEGHEERALAGASRLINESPMFAAMIEILHMSAETIALLAQQWQMFVLDIGARTMTRVMGASPRVIESLRSNKRFYMQDAVIVPVRLTTTW